MTHTCFSRRRFLALTACTAICSTSAAALASSGSGFPKNINIVYVKAPFNLQNIVMKKNGMLERAFAEHGCTIRWHSITSGAKQAQAMAAGSIDVSAVMNTTSLLLANGAGNPIIAFHGVSHPSPTFAAMAKDPEIKSFRDLKGRKVAGPRGTVLHQLLAAGLAKEGLSMSDVEFLSMDQPAAAAALSTGRVDAALLAASGIVKAQESGARIISTAEGLVDVNLVMTASKRFVDAWPRAVELISEVQTQALDWIEQNYEEALKIGADEHGIAISEARRLASWSRYYNKLDQRDVDALKADMNFLVENGMLDEPFDIEPLFLPSAFN